MHLSVLLLQLRTLAEHTADRFAGVRPFADAFMLFCCACSDLPIVLDSRLHWIQYKVDLTSNRLALCLAPRPESAELCQIRSLCLQRM
jgi:hypothetical protein